MNYINRLLLVCSSLILLAGCKGNIACQNPPPVLRFVLNTPNGANAVTADNAGQIAIRYARNGQPTTIKDVRVSTGPSYAVESYELIEIARQTSDTTQFHVVANDKTLGAIQLKTYVDNSPCDGWTHINELRFNGQVVAYDNMKPGYTLVVAP